MCGRGTRNGEGGWEINFYLVIEVPDHVYVFYGYRLYFADKDIYMIWYFHHKIEIIRLFFFLIHFAEIFLDRYYLMTVRNFRSLCSLVSKVRYVGPFCPDVILFHHLAIMIATVCLIHDCFHHRNKLYHI